jgi:hypothetical protein
MAFIESTYPIVLTSGGGTINLSVNDPYSDYDITGTATLVASYNIQATGTPVKNTKFVFNYEASITLSGNTLTIFGLSLDASQALQSCFIVSKYDGSAWDTQIQPDFENSNVIETKHIINDAVDKDKIAADVAGSGLGQNADGSLEVKVDASTIEINTDTLRIKDDGVTNAKLAEMTSYTLKGNNTGSTANPQDIAIATLVNSNAWGVTGNSGTNPNTNFIGTTDAQELVIKINNIEYGKPIDLSLGNVTYGTKMLNTTTGDYNTGIGLDSLTNIDTGYNNTAVGHHALAENITGYQNSALGKGSLQYVEGYSNTGIGDRSGIGIINGNKNTMIGAETEVSSNTATNRIALGYGAEATANYQFAIPDDVTTIKFKGLTYTLPTSLPAVSGVLTCSSTGVLTWA